MNILVTGSNGQLGFEIQQLVIKYPNFRFYFHDIETLDICNPKQLESLVKEIKPSIIINCAAYTAVDKAETETEIARHINAVAVENLAKVASIHDSWLFQISTDYVFDGMGYIPYKEDSDVKPQSAYGQTKLEGEQLALKYTKGIVIRTSWLYSSHGNNFVKTMLRFSTEKSELRIIADQIGSPTYAADLANAILTIANSQHIKAGIYHYANEGACSWFDFASEIIAQSGNKCKVTPIETKDYPLPAKRPAYSVLSKTKIKQLYNIEIPWWKDSLTKCIGILKSNN
jgi:dTDP-4-dehydrorhamnose reductase